MPLSEQFGLGAGWALLTVQPPRGHVGKLEAQHGKPTRSKALRHVLHELAVHRRASTVGQNQGGVRLAKRAIPQPCALTLPLHVLIPVNTRDLPDRKSTRL